jgi:hydroxyacylglutathione hydrolase
MLPSKNISNNVIKIISDSNCYIIERKILIDTSKKELKNELLETIKQIIDPSKIKKVIFTHLHYDHIESFDLFKNAKFYANKEAVIAMKNEKEKQDMILRKETSKNFNIELNDVIDDLEIKSLFEITNTPGHSSSCIILYYKKDNILFTGDMYFYKGCYGRTDLPNSEPKKMQKSIQNTLNIIEKFNPIIAPGYDY